MSRPRSGQGLDVTRRRSGCRRGAAWKTRRFTRQNRNTATQNLPKMELSPIMSPIIPECLMGGSFGGPEAKHFFAWSATGFGRGNVKWRPVAASCLHHPSNLPAKAQTDCTTLSRQSRKPRDNRTSQSARLSAAGYRGRAVALLSKRQYAQHDQGRQNVCCGSGAVFFRVPTWTDLEVVDNNDRKLFVDIREASDRAEFIRLYLRHDLDGDGQVTLYRA